MSPRSARGRPARRVAAAALAAAALLPAPPWTLALARQDDPARLHIEGSVTGPIVESPDAMKVTSTIQCFCGTCVNQTLHECTCGLAARERSRVASDLEAGRTPEQIIAAYVAEHGPQVRIVPERRGLNLVGWIVPFAVSLAGVGGLAVVLRSWRRRGLSDSAAAAAGPEGAGATASSGADRTYAERLERDLKEMDA